MKIKLLLAVILIVMSMALICAPTLLLPEAEVAEIYLKAEDGFKTVFSPANVQELSNDKDFMGIRLEIEGNTLSAAEVMERLAAVRSRRSDIMGKECYYAYSPLLGAGVNVGGRLVNVQIVKDENCLIVGIPLIMGSY